MSAEVRCNGQKSQRQRAWTIGMPITVSVMMLTDSVLADDMNLMLEREYVVQRERYLKHESWLDAMEKERQNE